MDRAERERKAYDEEHVWEHSHRWHMRFRHVFESPNTLRHERLFEELLQRSIQGKRVLEIGCGSGENAQKLHSLGAKYVLGIDVAETFVAEAKKYEIKDVLEFAVRDVSQSQQDVFDMIVGRSILHHIDYRNVLKRLYRENLANGGFMLFMEPFGSNPLLKLYTLIARSAHTPDERSFTTSDLRWFQDSFASTRIFPFNFVSLPAGIISSFLFSQPNNALLRTSDAVDMWLARRVSALTPAFRHGLILIEKNSVK